MSSDTPLGDAPVELPMDGVLDLHTFRPRDIGALIPDWLAACQERGLLELRIIHGKGVGNLQRSVHALLVIHPFPLRRRLCAAPHELLLGIGALPSSIVQLEPSPRFAFITFPVDN